MLSTASPNPRHLLLLPPVTDDYTINQHTGFNVIDGASDVERFLLSDEGKKHAWLDMRERDFADDLLPQEIAELLYLAHKKTHMTLPFYYKLQNEYARVPMPTGLVNSYWRHPDEFAAVLSAAVNRQLQTLLSAHPFWAIGNRHNRGMIPLKAQLQSQWHDMLPDGLGFDFGRAKVNNAEVRIPILRIQERQLLLGVDESADNAQELGYLLLDRKARKWHLDLN